MSKTILNLIQIVLAVLLSILILLQAKAGGLGSAFGDFSGIYRSKRGVEKLIFWATIVVAILFFAAAILGFTFFS